MYVSPKLPLGNPPDVCVSGTTLANSGTSGHTVRFRGNKHSSCWWGFFPKRTFYSRFAKDISALRISGGRQGAAAVSLPARRSRVQPPLSARGFSLFACSPVSAGVSSGTSSKLEELLAWLLMSAPDCTSTLKR